MQLLSSHLLENKVTSALSEQKEPAFEDPVELGMKKICNTSWVTDTLSKLPVEEEEEQGSQPDNMIEDLDYEVFDVVI